MVYLETGHKKYNYFTEEEVKTLSKDELLLQACLGLQTCKQVKDAIKIMEDIWQISKEKEKQCIRETIFLHTNADGRIDATKLKQELEL